MEDYDLDLSYRFSLEVINQGPEAALPKNLSNEWLEILSDSLEQALGIDEESETELNNKNMGILLEAILHILMSKDPNQSQISIEDLFKYYQYYQIEIALEQIRRCTEVQTSPATLEDIFTDRDVIFHASP